MITPKHLIKNIKSDYRLIVISDIHGHLDRLKALLEKVEYNDKDYLVILGDFVEKGDQVIETIHYVQQLDKNRRTFVLAGNCEWALHCLLRIPELAGEIPKYLKRVSTNGCIRQRYRELHLKDGRETMLGIQKQIADSLKDELDYLSHLPVSLKFNQFLFVHAGVEKRRDYQESSLSTILEMQYFYNQGHILDETVIVGHLPTSNYDQHYIHNDIIIDEKKKIICIDGGIGVKPVAQLNAFIIENHKGTIIYKTEYVQPLPMYTVVETVCTNQDISYKIAYPHFQVEVLEIGKQFSLCFQKETNQKLYIKNEFLYKKSNQVFCLDDYTDYMINAKKGDNVKLIGIYGEYAYIIHNQQIGWIELKYLCINS